MTREEFEVWKFERERTYRDQLLALREDLANRGLTYSGTRAQEEQCLKEKFDTEVRLARIQMEQGEDGKSSWFPDGNWKPFVLSSIVSIVIGVAVFYLTK